MIKYFPPNYQIDSQFPPELVSPIFCGFNRQPIEMQAVARLDILANYFNQRVVFIVIAGYNCPDTDSCFYQNSKW